MSAVNIKRLAEVISAHAWNGDRTKVAICPNTPVIQIFQYEKGDFVLEQELTEHDQVVTGLDWGAKTNRIVSCSQDRNAYVWSQKKGATNDDISWKPTLVLLRINRAATSVKWSPLENKFAVSTGSRLVSICYFEVDNDWWVSKHIKKHKSTCTAVAWSADNVLVATASTDGKCRVFAAGIKTCDEKPADTPFGNKLVFGSVLAEYESNSWVQAVAWSPSGKRLAFASSDSSLTFVDCPSEQQVVYVQELPFRDLIFVTENSVVAVGHGNVPYLFTCNNGTWKAAGSLDVGGASGGAAKPAAGGASRAAFDKFSNLVTTGQESGKTALDTTHQNAITQIQALVKAQGRVSDFSTSGLDGNVGQWNLAKAAAAAKLTVV